MHNINTLLCWQWCDGELRVDEEEEKEAKKRRRRRRWGDWCLGTFLECSAICRNFVICSRLRNVRHQHPTTPSSDASSHRTESIAFISNFNIIIQCSLISCLQAKIHYLDIISGLPSYGAKCFSTNQRDGVERVLLISPRFGLSQIAGIRNTVVSVCWLPVVIVVLYAWYICGRKMVGRRSFGFLLYNIDAVLRMCTCAQCSLRRRNDGSQKQQSLRENPMCRQHVCAVRVCYSRWCGLPFISNQIEFDNHKLFMQCASGADWRMLQCSKFRNCGFGNIWATTQWNHISHINEAFDCWMLIQQAIFGPQRIQCIMNNREISHRYSENAFALSFASHSGHSKPQWGMSSHKGMSLCMFRLSLPQIDCFWNVN